MTTGRINQVSTSALAPPTAEAINECGRMSASSGGTVNSRRQLLRVSIPFVVSTTLHQAKRHQRTKPRDDLRPKHRRLRSTDPEGFTRFDSVTIGMSLWIRIRLPSWWPAPNKPTTDTVKRQGPAEQPSTVAPELLPDREANVNRIRKAGH